MKLAMTLLVRNEEDILEANLEHHLSEGVDVVVVTDNGSIDGTLDILNRYERAGVVHLLHEASDDYAQGRWVTRMARLACDQLGADWVINADADEFFWPRAGTLRSTLEAYGPEVSVVSAGRLDFVPVEGQDEPFFERMVFRHAGGVGLMGRRLLPKVCHRAVPDVIVAQGNHRVSGGGLGEPVDDGGLEILHFPLRSYLQFERKILAGGAAYGRNNELPPSAGRVWRDLYALHGQGLLRRRYDEEVLTAEGVRAGLAAGALLEDTRLRDRLRRLRSPEGTET